MGKAVKIIDVDETGENFVLLEDELLSVCKAVPREMPIAVVSILGEVRKGKSFILNFFLRYLTNTDGSILESELDVEDKQLAWMSEGGNLEGVGDKENEGFKWGGEGHQTTKGIWMWDEYFVRVDPVTKKNIAVLLVDTQGINDRKLVSKMNDTLFGLTSLLSSYLIFTVEKEFREDHMCQLSQFSKFCSISTTNCSNPELEKRTNKFQTLEILVKDYDDFPKDHKKQDMTNIYSYMEMFLQETLSQNIQIQSCYEEIKCYLLPHPGAEVSERVFEGEIMEIRPHFKRLLGDYVRRVFNERVLAQTIQGEEISALRFFEVTKEYCRRFQDHGGLPKAMTLFRATEEASCRHASKKALKRYKHKINILESHDSIQEQELQRMHQVSLRHAKELFYSSYKAGRKTLMDEVYSDVLKKLNASFGKKLNEHRMKEKEEQEKADEVISQCFEKYKDLMGEAGIGKHSLNQKKLDESHELALIETMKLYNSTNNPKTIEILQREPKKLGNMIQDTFERYRNANTVREMDEKKNVEKAIRSAKIAYDRTIGAYEQDRDEMIEEELFVCYKKAREKAIEVYKDKAQNANPQIITEGAQKLNNQLDSARKYLKTKNSKKLGEIMTGAEPLEQKVTLIIQANIEAMEIKEEEESTGFDKGIVQALEIYIKKMSSVDLDKCYNKEETLVSVHQAAMGSALKSYENWVKPKNQTLHERGQVCLKDMCETCFGGYNWQTSVKDKEQQEAIGAAKKIAIKMHNEVLNILSESDATYIEEELLSELFGLASDSAMQCFEQVIPSGSKRLNEEGRHDLQRSFNIKTQQLEEKYVKKRKRRKIKKQTGFLGVLSGMVTRKRA